MLSGRRIRDNAWLVDILAARVSVALQSTPGDFRVRRRRCAAGLTDGVSTCWRCDVMVSFASFAHFSSELGRRYCRKRFGSKSRRFDKLY